MPLELERALKVQANRKGLTGKRRKAYIYGTMRKTGWVPSHQKKGRRKKWSDKL
jgi:hypothetical protein